VRSHPISPKTTLEHCLTASHYFDIPDLNTTCQYFATLSLVQYELATPWHQDEPYWLVEGYDTCTLLCTLWMPWVAVKKGNALAYVPGSHRLDTVFHQYNFASLDADEKPNVD